MLGVQHAQEDPLKPNAWAKLPHDIKLNIFGRLDKPSRRAVRTCSYEDMMLIEKFPYRKKMDLSCYYCHQNAKWQSEIFGKIENADGISEVFDTSAQAYEYLKQKIRTSESIGSLRMDLVHGSRFRLRDDRKLVPVSKLSLKMVNEDDSVESTCTDFLTQLEPSHLKYLELLSERSISSSSVLNENFFQLEKQTIELDYLSFHGKMSDQQFLGLRTNFIVLHNSSEISIDGFVQITRKFLNRTSFDQSYELRRISSELVFYLFGATFWCSQMYGRADLFISINGEARIVQMSAFGYFANRHVDIHLQIIPTYGENISNRATTNEFPGLTRFMQTVAEDMPFPIFLL